jgi:hypothetical protein
MAAFEISKSILTPVEWRRLYPSADYNKTPHAQKHFVHYWALNNQKLESVITFFEKKKAAGDQVSSLKSLKRKDSSHFRLTPLMVAVMKGHVGFAKFLLDAIKERTSHEQFIKHLNSVDSYGFTALHHAAIAAPSFVNVLLENGANPKTTTKPGYSYEHLRLLTDPTLEADSAGKTFWEVNGELKKVSELTPEEKEQIGITHFRDLYLYQGSSGLRQLWQNQTPINAASPEKIGCPNASLKSLPELEIRRHPTLPDGNVGLFAKTFLPYGSLISTYGGVFTSQSIFHTFDAQMKSYWEGKESEYAWASGIDGQHVCSPMTRANTGLPNAVQHPMLVDGIPIEAPLLVMAPEGIQPGEEIIFDYGDNSGLLWNKQILLNKEKIDAFASPGLTRILRNLINSPPLTRSHMESCLSFLMTNPKALIYVHMKRHILAEDWAVCFLGIFFPSKRFNPFDLIFNEKQGNRLQKICALLTALGNFDEAFAKLLPSAQHALENWILDAIDTHSVFQIIRVMELVTRELDPASFGIAKESDPASFDLAEITRGIDEYDWLNDPVSILRERTTFRIFHRYRLAMAHVPIDDVLKGLKQELQDLQTNQDLSRSDVRDFEEILKELIDDLTREQAQMSVEESKARAAKRHSLMQFIHSPNNTIYSD